MEDVPKSVSKGIPARPAGEASHTETPTQLQSSVVASSLEPAEDVPAEDIEAADQAAVEATPKPVPPVAPKTEEPETETDVLTDDYDPEYMTVEILALENRLFQFTIIQTLPGQFVIGLNNTLGIELVLAVTGKTELIKAVSGMLEHELPASETTNINQNESVKDND